jgi:hypothetical protein
MPDFARCLRRLVRTLALAAADGVPIPAEANRIFLCS